MDPEDGQWVRWTLRLPKPIWDEIREAARHDQRSLNGQVVTVLRRYVDNRRKARGEPPLPDPGAAGSDGGPVRYRMGRGA
jgi:hypothetical protein